MQPDQFERMLNACKAQLDYILEEYKNVKKEVEALRKDNNYFSDRNNHLLSSFAAYEKEIKDLKEQMVLFHNEYPALLNNYKFLKQNYDELLKDRNNLLVQLEKDSELSRYRVAFSLLIGKLEKLLYIYPEQLEKDILEEASKFINERLKETQK